LFLYRSERYSSETGQTCNIQKPEKSASRTAIELRTMPLLCCSVKTMMGINFANPLIAGKFNLTSAIVFFYIRTVNLGRSKISPATWHIGSCVKYIRNSSGAAVTMFLRISFQRSHVRKLSPILPSPRNLKWRPETGSSCTVKIRLLTHAAVTHLK
jgi:hypothetical protein